MFMHVMWNINHIYKYKEWSRHQLYLSNNEAFELLKTFVTNFLDIILKNDIFTYPLFEIILKYPKKSAWKFPCNLIWILYNPEGRWDGSIIYSILLLVSKVLFFSHNIGLRDIGL